MTPQDLAKKTGQHQLFLGIPTYSWSLAQFQKAAQFARSHGVDCLLVKVADGGNIWYGGMSGWHNIRNTILAEGVGAIPYIYSYGNKFGALDAEIDILIAHLQDIGIICMNAEAEWNGQVSWAQHLCSRMQPVPGTFLVSTWANPSVQNWLGVIQALAPCTTVFMPQQYNNHLATFYWQEFAQNGAAYIQPTLNLTEDFGANDPVQNAIAAHDQGHTAISVWYYEAATANPGLLDAVYAAFPKGGNTTMIPQGWSDDGTTLTAPNGHKVVLGFRDFVLANNWDPNNVPLEEEQGANPVEEYYDQGPNNAGTRQLFNYSELAWISARGVYVVGIGNELRGCRHERDILKASLAAAQAEIDSNPAVAKIHAFKQALSDLASV